MFCFTFFYINDEDERVVFFTHPIYLTNFENSEALEALLMEVERLAEFLDSHIIEMEVHEQITGPVSFPTSLSFFSYDLDNAAISKPDAALLRRSGFREEVEVICLDQSIQAFESKADEIGEKHDRYAVTPVSPTEFTMIKAKAHNFPVKSYELTRSDRAFKPTNLPFFEDVAYTARKRSRWSLRKTSDEGYLRWTPNIMEPFNESRNPFPLLFYHALEEHVYEYGKIFDWGLSRADRALFAPLLSQAAMSMKQRGIKRFQFAHVDSDQKFIKGFLEEFGFNTTHKIKLLRKKVG